MTDIAQDLLQGAIDFHIHAGPDVVPRLMDDLQLAEAARDAGMGGIVLKTHHMMTADRARIAQRLFPEIRVFGGLALNSPTCGGLNPEAVRVALRLGARVVWLPTISAANHIEKTRKRTTASLGALSKGFTLSPIELLDEAGAAKPALQEILEMVAEANIVLATGHISALEITTVVEAALAAGARKILVNHPEIWLIGMSLEQQRSLAAKGVTFERCLRSATSPDDTRIPIESIADQIRAVGADSTIMATDYGQVDSHPAPQGMLLYIRQMLEQGIPADDIDKMVRVNPARLLDL